jgi:YebC/PmpR family DNA-binding regulatory protein
MAGHSHWKTIKYKKGAADAQKSKAFSKLARLISVAVREKGSNPETNSKLRTAIEKAKELNMPSENIERAIKRGAGTLEGIQLEETLLEAYGPGGTAIIIEGITDNKNRTLGEIKQILAQNGGKLANEGSVRWMFERKGVLTINGEQFSEEKKEEVELLAIEAGAENFSWNDTTLNVYTKPEELDKVKRNLEAAKMQIENVSLDWVPKEYKEVKPEEKDLLEKLFGALDENDAVQEIYSNLKNT